QNLAADWLNYTFGTSFYRFNDFLMAAMRYDSSCTGNTTRKQSRSTLVNILRSNLPTAAKTKKLKECMDQWGHDHSDGDPRIYPYQIKAPDQNRIRNCRRALTFRRGNCGEKSSICATYCLENAGGPLNIFWMDANRWVNGQQHGWDHAYVIIGASKG